MTPPPDAEAPKAPELPGDAPPIEQQPVRKAPENLQGTIPVAQKSKVKRGTVLLRYEGESPVRAVQNVPSGSQYRINPAGMVRVYPEDAQVLLTRPDFVQVG